ncbi:hypothetical protein CPB83DRAFT_853843 [Crepidotus variabilis]|uniref:Uncharacterized protein n=1 Tax=Crepidotus variabilis TaxID=179855 RepID=A0A9P6EFZ2_9AGAR|nr:hypothetical protein CPB83DRAFT_853843 [Crepidotus variabilis]
MLEEPNILLGICLLVGTCKICRGLNHLSQFGLLSGPLPLSSAISPTLQLSCYEPLLTSPERRRLAPIVLVKSWVRHWVAVNSFHSPLNAGRPFLADSRVSLGTDTCKCQEHAYFPPNSVGTVIRRKPSEPPAFG